MSADKMIQHAVAVVETAREMFATCPADDDSTTEYEKAVHAFRCALTAYDEADELYTVADVQTVQRRAEATVPLADYQEMQRNFVEADAVNRVLRGELEERRRKGVTVDTRAADYWRGRHEAAVDELRGARAAQALECDSCNEEHTNLGPRSPDEMRHCRGCYAVLEMRADHAEAASAELREALEEQRRYYEESPIWKRLEALAAKTDELCRPDAQPDEAMLHHDQIARIRPGENLNVGDRVLVVEGPHKGLVGRALSWRQSGDGHGWQVTFAWDEQRRAAPLPSGSSSKGKGT